jgi:enoyl-CoA hydratase/carnithine racemase
MTALPALHDCTLAVDGRVATLTFNRDDIRNALSGSRIGTELVEVIDWANRSDQVSVLVLTGAGASFSAGGNVKTMRERTAVPVHQVAKNYRYGIQRIPLALHDCDVPVIAAVNGHAVGAGCDLALMCDLRIGSTAAVFGETFVNLGIIPGDGGSWFLQRVVGYQRAAEMTFTGRMVEAQEAQALGILLEVVAPDELAARANELAQRIARKPPVAIRSAKRLLKLAQRTPLPEYLDLCAAQQALCHKTEDHAEALAAFLEQRRPEFRGL